MYQNAVELYKKGNYSQSINIFLDLIKQNKDDHTILNLIGMGYYALSDFSKAEDYLLQAYDFEQSIIEYPSNLGILYFAMRDYDKAYEYLNLALQIKEEHMGSLLTLIDVQIYQGKLDDAQATTLKALSYDENNVIVNKKAAYLNIVLGNKSQAIGHYNKILESFPDEVDSILKLAELYGEMGIYNEALKYFKRLFEVEPSYKNNLFLKGTIHQIYNKLFPINRFEFYNNKSVIKNLKELLKSINLKDKKVVELGGVEGLLSMICAKEGAKVKMIHGEKFFVEKAKLIAKDNNLSDNISFIEKSFSYMKENEMQKDIDLIITDLYGTFIPQYEYLLNLYNFKNKFLSEKGKIFPERLRFEACLIESEKLYDNGTINHIEGIDMSILNHYRPMYKHDNIFTDDTTILTDIIELHDFDLSSVPERTIQGKIEIKIKKSATVHGIAFWLSNEFNNQIFENTTGKQFIYLFDESIKVQENENIDLGFICSRVAMFYLEKKN
ncbi:tetratricopeptide repeat protein [Arcobacter sp. YIC-310]|uniref:tetratricopeptide repeat protein n=1 Tax=Arcobacter sp. YIC-310 TaxID=3376632 RepID=UPI003C27A66F